VVEHLLRVGIIGPGRAGLGLALALRAAGVRVEGVHGRRRKRVPPGISLTVGPLPPWLGKAGVVIVAVRDEGIAGVVRLLVAARLTGTVVVHLSGAQGAEALAPLRRAGAAVGAMHPLMSVARDPREAPSRFRGATFAIDGDPAAVRAARALARRLGGRPVIISAGSRARYHAGAVFASNYLVTLLALAEEQLVAAGFAPGAARAALAPLAGATIANVAAAGPAAALTGPIARGDAATVRRHLAALPRAARRVYAALIAPTARLAGRRPPQT
jgi:predicted short-subunit dehydrogenase-like oxidoreductase (DUF2520 family)